MTQPERHSCPVQSLGVVLRAAEVLQCKDMHHPPIWRHRYDEPCPAEQRLQEHIAAVREWLGRNQ